MECFYVCVESMLSVLMIKKLKIKTITGTAVIIIEASIGDVKLRP